MQDPIIGTPDERHAIAMYTPCAEDFWAYYTHDVPSDDSTNACNKPTTFFKHTAQAGQTYSDRTFLVGARWAKCR